MKKNTLHAALFASMIPMSLHAIGLGEMTVRSALDQPFLAEIKLLDVGNVALNTLRASVADPESFEQIGLEPIAALNLFNFKIERNDQGRWVIKIQSQERITEPYIELLLDLSWPQGQLDKKYTILLDPADYQLVSSKGQTYYSQAQNDYKEPGVINKSIMSDGVNNSGGMKTFKNKSSYGPTSSNENVWQIAQRYKTNDLVLPQVVLAILGANPEAFKEENINGLKEGVRLEIPSSQDISLVPADLATAEVMAHDKAWNEHAAINHVLLPPYMNKQISSPDGTPKEALYYSSVPSIPKSSLESYIPSQGLIPKSINPAVFVEDLNQSQSMDKKVSQASQDIRAELSLTAAAIESVRESNALLKAQFKELQKQNKQLELALKKRNKDFELIQAQLDAIIKNRASIGSSATSASEEEHSPWSLLWLILFAAGGGGFAYWYFRIRPKRSDEPNSSLASDVSKPWIDESIQPEQKEEMPALFGEAEQSYGPTAQEVQSQTEVLPEPIEELSVTQTQVEPEISPEPLFVPKAPAPQKTKKQTKKAHITNDEIAPTDEKKPTDAPIEEDSITFEALTLSEEPVEKTDEKAKSLNESIEPEKDATVLAFAKEQKPLSEEPPLSKKPLDQTPEEQSEEEDEFLEFLAAETGLNQEQPVFEPKPIEPDDHELEALNLLEFTMPTQSERQIIKNSDAKENSDVEAKQEHPQDEVVFEPEEDTQEGLVFEPSDEQSPLLEIDLNDMDKKTKEFFTQMPDEEADITKERLLPQDSEENDNTTSPLKNASALDTLLALAKTYISMDDFDSARSSLNEVVEFGTQAQKEEATRLLHELDKK